MISIPHPIKRKIVHQHAFISQLLDHFPALYKEWENGLQEDFQQQAKEFAEGDQEIEWDTYRNMSSWLETQYDEIPLFYNSMAVSIYSYYEDIIRLIAQECGTKELLKAICETKGIKLSSELQASIDSIDSEMKVIRNQICHNNAGTPKASKFKSLKSLSSRENEICFEDGVLSIHGDEYLKKVLEQEYEILITLAEKLGYKTKRL